MMRSLPVAVTGLVLLGSCANPLNQATSDRYADTCAVAERNGRLDVAEEACYRALVNVDMGNLGPALKSNRLYNLGRIKRQLSKFAEAEELLRQALAIEEKLSSPTDLKIGRRLIELAISLADQGRWDEGAQYLEKAAPISGQYTGNDRSVAAFAFSAFAKQLHSTQPHVAERFDQYAAALK